MKAPTTIESVRHTHVRQMIVGLAVIGIAAHGVIILMIAIAGYSCS